jgi:UDP-N-acetylglucosamine--dolichyl-phosphate N-acetylglucosaminephosphotransferase
VVLAILGGSFLCTLVATSLVIPRLRDAAVVGEDVHKKGRPEVPEMGGLVILIGFGGGVLLTLAMKSFFHLFVSANMLLLVAALSTILLAGLIGILDDLLGMSQWAKALLPVFAAFPLMAVRAGHTWVWIPFFGTVNWWIFYPLVLVPLGITVAANAVNMLAGFNGLEVGLGIVAMGSLSILAVVLEETTALIVLLSGLGALVVVIYYNWYPSRLLVGDVGTLSVGAIIATAVIVGNFETAGVVVMIPYAVEFLLKATHGFPSGGEGTAGRLGEDGRLHCPATGPVGLGQLLMKLFGGLHERTLVLILMGIEAIFGILAIALYLWI